MKDDFNKKAIHPLQSWEWGEFREAWGNKAIRLPNFQIIFSKVPFTNFKIGTVIRGPKLTKRDVFEVLKAIRSSKHKPSMDLINKVVEEVRAEKKGKRK